MNFSISFLALFSSSFKFSFSSFNLPFSSFNDLISSFNFFISFLYFSFWVSNSFKLFFKSSISDKYFFMSSFNLLISSSYSIFIRSISFLRLSLARSRSLMSLPNFSFVSTKVVYFFSIILYFVISFCKFSISSYKFLNLLSLS